jgi:ABC-type transport system substrate-binding protein/ABC-type dipeptide/oligopeptide/nickel transport system permease subunit
MARDARSSRRLHGVHGLSARLLRVPAAVVGLTLVTALALFAVLGPKLIGRDPNESDFTLSRTAFGAPPGPSRAHLLGVDALFRDELARLAEGARVSLAIALLATLIATTLGAALGSLAGMTAGSRLAFVDAALMRLCDVVLALPYLLLVIAVGAAVGHTDASTIVLILGLGGFTGCARLCRAKTLQIRGLDFVTAARALGARPLGIVARHVIPNLAASLVAVAGAGVAQMILAEAALSYLTVGLDPPRATWGRMLHEAEPYLGARFGLIAAPGLMILLSALAFYKLGEGLGEALEGGDARRPRAPRTRVPFDVILAAAALLLLSVAQPSAVGPPLTFERTAERPRRGGVLHVATLINLRSLDPALATDETWRSVSELCFARLVTWDAEGRVVPDLAREVSASADGASYTFALREELRFHDGTELLARDVKRSLERLLHPKTPSPAASFYANIKGFRAFHDGGAPELSGVRVTGERSVTIDLEAPDATFLPKMTLTFAAPVCASAGAFADPASAALPCGAGPMRVERWEPDLRLTLARFDAYYKPGLPYLDGVEWLLNMPAVTQRYKFERGELDFLHDVPPRDIPRYEASPAWAPYTRWTPASSINGVFLNTEVPPLDNRALRRAIALGLDPSVLTRLGSGVAPANRLLPPSLPGEPAERPPMRAFDRARALAEMAAAGYPFDPATGEGGYPGTIDFLVIPDTGDQQMAEIWQQQLAKIGIRLRLRLVTYGTFLAEVGRRRASPMGRAGWSADFPDPSNFFESLLSTAAIQDEGSQNPSFFSNAELDALLARAHGDPDPERRAEAYERAEAIVRDEAPWIPLFVRRGFEVWQPWLEDYMPGGVVAERFNEVWLSRADRGAARVELGGAPEAPREMRGAR